MMYIYIGFALSQIYKKRHRIEHGKTLFDTNLKNKIRKKNGYQKTIFFLWLGWLFNASNTDKTIRNKSVTKLKKRKYSFT